MDNQPLPTTTPVGAPEGRLDLVAEQGVTPPQVVSAFGEATGCATSVTYAGSSDQIDALARSGSYDGVAASSELAGRLIADDEAAPVDTSLIPGYGDLPGKLQSPQATTVNGVHYGVAFLWGANLLLANTRIVTPVPDSWSLIFNGAAYPGRVTVPDSPLYIADAALYLKSVQPGLHISNPFELTRPQFDAAVALVRKQRPQIGAYWTSRAGELHQFASGAAVIGQGGYAASAGPPKSAVPIAAVVPDEGVTGSIDSWMELAGAAHPNCMQKWLAYISTPIVQADAALLTGASPANPKACVELNAARPGFCAGRHIPDDGFLGDVTFAVAPSRNCGNGSSDCIDYSTWVTAWEAATS